jgi:hypothetical protein
MSESQPRNKNAALDMLRSRYGTCFVLSSVPFTHILRLGRHYNIICPLSSYISQLIIKCITDF